MVQYGPYTWLSPSEFVLILVVVDNGLVLVDLETLEFYNVVLILVVVDNGLVQKWNFFLDI